MPTVFVTCPIDAAGELAATLVDERLAACVNRVACTSTYRWDGDVMTDDEAILFCKTTDRGYEPLADRVRELHPYEVPCIERFDVDDADPDFAAWIDEAVG